MKKKKSPTNDESKKTWKNGGRERIENRRWGSKIRRAAQSFGHLSLHITRFAPIARFTLNFFPLFPPCHRLLSRLYRARAPRDDRIRTLFFFFAARSHEHRGVISLYLSLALLHVPHHLLKTSQRVFLSLWQNPIELSKRERESGSTRV